MRQVLCWSHSTVWWGSQWIRSFGLAPLGSDHDVPPLRPLRMPVPSIIHSQFGPWRLIERIGAGGVAEGVSRASTTRITALLRSRSCARNGATIATNAGLSSLRSSYWVRLNIRRSHACVAAARSKACRVLPWIWSRGRLSMV